MEALDTLNGIDCISSAFSLSTAGVVTSTATASASSSSTTAADLETLSLQQLRDILTSNGRDSTGKKPQLIARIRSEGLCPSAPIKAAGGVASHIDVQICEHLQHIPWEALPRIRASGASIRRHLFTPSVDASLQHLCMAGGSNAAAASAGRATGLTVVLNPSGDLGKTQARLEPVLRELGAQFTNVSAFVGSPPEPVKLTTALPDSAAYVYCGHGAGEKYLRHRALSSFSKFPASLLMGCSSARLVVSDRLDGELDGPTRWLLTAGAPVVVGNLWDVTDKDIDNFTVQVAESVQRALASHSHAVPSCAVSTVLSECLPGVVAENRNVCKMAYLVGAAPVCYTL